VKKTLVPTSETTVTSAKKTVSVALTMVCKVLSIDSSSDGGALLRKGIDSQPDLTARLAACIDDNRQQSNAPSKKDLHKLAIELADIVVSHHAERLGGRADRITIDLDPTDDPTHRKQQLSFFNGYYDTWCYLPVVGTIRGRGDAENRIKELHTQSSIGGHLR
jgi:hypothetical protein